MNNDGCKVEQHTRDLIRVFLKILSNHDAVEEDFRFWERGGLHRLRPNGSSIRRVRGSEVRKHDVLWVIRFTPALHRRFEHVAYIVGAVRMPVTVFLAERAKQLFSIPLITSPGKAAYERGGCNRSFQSLFTRLLVRSVPILEVGCSRLATYNVIRSATRHSAEERL